MNVKMIDDLAFVIAESLTEEGVTFEKLMKLRAEAIKEARQEMEKIKGTDDGNN